MKNFNDQNEDLRGDTFAKQDANYNISHFDNKKSENRLIFQKAQELMKTSINEEEFFNCIVLACKISTQEFLLTE